MFVLYSYVLCYCLSTRLRCIRFVFDCFIFVCRVLFCHLLYKKGRPARPGRVAQHQDLGWGKYLPTAYTLHPLTHTHTDSTPLYHLCSFEFCPFSCSLCPCMCAFLFVFAYVCVRVCVPFLRSSHTHMYPVQLLFVRPFE